MLDIIPVDGIQLAYATASESKQRAVSTVLQKSSFLISSTDSFVGMVGVNAKTSLDLSLSIILALEQEYGLAYTRSLLSVLFSKLSSADQDFISRKKG